MFTSAQTDKRAIENKVNSEDVLCFMLKRSKTNAIVEFTVFILPLATKGV